MRTAIRMATRSISCTTDRNAVEFEFPTKQQGRRDAPALLPYGTQLRVERRVT